MGAQRVDRPRRRQHREHRAHTDGQEQASSPVPRLMPLDDCTHERDNGKPGGEAEVRGVKVVSRRRGVGDEQVQRAHEAGAIDGDDRRHDPVPCALRHNTRIAVYGGVVMGLCVPEQM
jgi:hypothetical protein